MRWRVGTLLVACVSTLLVVASEDAAITEPMAQSMLEEVHVQVARLRGLEFERQVPVRVINDETAKKHLLDRLESFGALEQFRKTQIAYQLLGLVPRDVDLLEALLSTLREQAGGFYDPASGAFFLLDDAPPELARALAAHELTHALEDQHFDLDARLVEVLDDDDRLFARGAVHEGSATLVMSFYVLEQVRAGALDLEAIQALGASELSKAGAMRALPDVLKRQLLGPYLLGQEFLAHRGIAATMAEGFPIADVNRAYRDGPDSSEQILHPHKFWDPERRDDPQRVSIEGAGDLLGRRWEREGEGVLGELNLGVLVGAETPMGPETILLRGAAAWTNAAASGWGGDRWELWTRGGSALVIGAIEWDTPEDAREFVSALPEMPDREWQIRERRVAIVAGDSGKKSARLLEALLAGGA